MFKMGAILPCLVVVCQASMEESHHRLMYETMVAQQKEQDQRHFELMLQGSKINLQIEEEIPDEPGFVDLGPLRFVDETLHTQEAQLPYYMLDLEGPYVMEDPFAARDPTSEEQYAREGEDNTSRRTNLRRANKK